MWYLHFYPFILIHFIDYVIVFVRIIIKFSSGLIAISLCEVLYRFECLLKNNNQHIESKKEGKDQESIQSSITYDPGYQYLRSRKTRTYEHFKTLKNVQVYPTYLILQLSFLR